VESKRVTLNMPTFSQTMVAQLFSNPPLKPQISHNTPFQKAIQSYQTEGQLVAYNITSKLTTNLMTCTNSVVAQLGCCCFIPLSQKKLTMLQFFADDDLNNDEEEIIVTKKVFYC